MSSDETKKATAQPSKKKSFKIKGIGVKDEEERGEFITNRHSGSDLFLEAKRVFSLSRYHNNRYFRGGITRDHEVAAENLTALERGHVYACIFASWKEPGKPSPVSRINVKSLRICDAETAPLISGLEFRNADSELAKKAVSRPEWDIHVPQALNHMFSIPPDRLDEFRNRVEKMGGKVILDGVTREEFHEVHNEFLDCLKIFDAAVVEIRISMDSLGLNSKLEEFETVLDQIQGLERGKYAIFQLLESMSEMEETAKRVGTDTAMIVLLGGALGTCRKRITIVRDLRTTMLSDEVKKRMAKAAEGKDTTEEDMYPLSYFLDSLRSSYPVLRKLEIVSNTEVKIPIGTSSITLTKNGITFEGRKSDLDRLAVGIKYEAEDIGDDGDRFGGI